MILAIVGPTGVGKTKLSIELAKKYNAIIINCDAMQVYKDLNIGTAKIKESEKEGIKHYLFDIVSPDTFYTVCDYQKDARKIIEENIAKNIIFVGGTGLYLKACLYDYQFSADNFNNDYANYANAELLNMCKKIDASCSIHVNNRVRLIRFLNRGTKPVTNSKELYKSLIIGLTTDRDTLYKKIDARVDSMLKEGLESEAESLYTKWGETKALKTAIGYKELIAYFKGDISLEEAINNIKKNSRHYAKRQYTFFNHQLPVHWYNVNYENFNETIDKVSEYIDEYLKRQ